MPEYDDEYCPSCLRELRAALKDITEDEDDE
jgi:hypothetical protein